MEKLYCPECGNYLEGGDGSMVDCHCGWKQERSIENDEDEIEQLRQRVQELEKELEDFESDIDTCTQHNVELQLEVIKLTTERDKATQYWQIAEGRCDALKQQRDELVTAAQLCIKENVFAPLMKAIASVKEK